MMGDGRAERLLRNAEGVAYWAAAAPALARLPAALGYRIACRRGDWLFRRQTGKAAELARNLRETLGSELSPAAAQQVTREWFRLASCEAVDVMRLRRGARPLRRLVEIDGREHLEAALAAGKGAILCCAHFGSYDSGFAVLHASGFPVTCIGRWQHRYTARLSSAERRFWELVYARPLRRHRQRPNIEPWPGRIEVAAQAAAVLRANEVVTISIDAPPLDSDRARAVEVPFLGRRARLLPGVVTLAQLTGAPVLMGFLYRSADYCHQVLEISAPVPAAGESAAFRRCAAEVSAAIGRSPAHWAYWASTADLATLGLVPPERDGSAPAGTRAAAGPGHARAAAITAGQLRARPGSAHGEAGARMGDRPTGRGRSAVDEKEILGHIDELIKTEHDLRARLAAGELSAGEEQARLRAAEEALDQCWDLLRQRHARREFGEDPGESAVRPVAEVEGYLQ